MRSAFAEYFEIMLTPSNLKENYSPNLLRINYNAIEKESYWLGWWGGSTFSGQFTKSDTGFGDTWEGLKSFLIRKRKEKCLQCSIHDNTCNIP